MKRRSFLAGLSAIGLSLPMSLIGGAAMAEIKTISGTAGYLERIALRPGAVLEVALVDVSRADAPSVRLSGQRFAMDRVPFPFTLSYDAALIDDRFTYAVQASIRFGDVVAYRTTTANLVLTRGAPDSVDLILERMPASAPVDEGGGLVGTRWEAFEIGGRMLITEKRPAIEFMPDGLAFVATGCNTFRGPVTVDAEQMRFSDKMAGTLMACPPPYDKLEKDVLETLPAVVRFARSEDQLALLNAAGVTVMRLSLQE